MIPNPTPYDFWYYSFLWSSVLTIFLFSAAVVYICWQWRSLLERYLPEHSLSTWQQKSLFERVRDISQLPMVMQQVASKGIVKKQRKYLEFEFGQKIHESLWVLPALMLLHAFSLYALLASSINSVAFSSGWNPLAFIEQSISNLFTHYGLSLFGLAFSFSLAAYVLIRLLREAAKYAEHYSDWMQLMNDFRNKNQANHLNHLQRAS